MEVRVDEKKIILLPLKKNYTDRFKGTVKGKLSFEDLGEIVC